MVGRILTRNSQSLSEHFTSSVLNFRTCGRVEGLFPYFTTLDSSEQPMEHKAFISMLQTLFHSNIVDFAQWLYRGPCAQLDMLVYGDFPRASQFAKHHLLICKEFDQRLRFQYFRSVASVDQDYCNIVDEKLRSIDRFALEPASKIGSAAEREAMFKSFWSS